MEIEELREILSSYDFEVNSMRNISKTYDISVKTIKKYLNLFNIEYPREPRRRSGVKLKRDRFGRFISNFRNADIYQPDRRRSDDVGKLSHIKNNNNSWNDEYQRIIESKPIRINAK